MKSIELTGEIIKTNTPFAVPLDAAVVNITPVQSGSGDPSPTNVRPISGWTGAKVTRAGKNLIPMTTISRTVYGVTFTSNEDGTVKVNGTATNDIVFQAVVVQLKAGSYIYTSGVVESFTTYDSFIVSADEKTIARGNNSLSPGNSFTLSEDSTVKIRCRTRLGFAVTDLTFYPMIRLATETDPTFEPYQGKIYDITFPSEAGTVYGGTLDVTTGLLTVTHGNIASYNGESLPGKWISSMDVYNAGGTPTTGAQVVYELATPQTYQLTPTQIALLAGENNVWADCGDIAIAYRPYHRFAFDGVNSIDNGMYVFPTDSMVAAPARQYTEQVVPGRSGVLLMDDGRYDNILHEYHVVTDDDGETNIALLRNMLASRVGYCRLTDTFDPDHYYMAVYNQNFTPVLEWRKRDMAKAVVSFYRKPQRFLLTGESIVVLTSSGSITNPTRFKSKPLIRVYGSGILGVGSTNITIANHGYSYMDIDCETGRAYYGATSLDSKVTLNAIDFPSLNPGSNGISKGSGITRIEITPRWWEL